MRFFSLLAALPVVLGLTAAAYLLMVYPSQAHPGRGRLVRVEIPPQASPSVIARRLGRAGLVERPRLFAAYLRLFAANQALREGSIAMRDNLDPGAVARRLLVRGVSQVIVTVPEGDNRYQIARRLEAQGVCDAAAFVAVTERRSFLDKRELSADTAEGYLFPDTYTLRRRMPAGAVAARMIQNFRRRMMPLLERHARGMAQLSEQLGFGIDDVVRLASIVEEEAAVDEERRLIAGVFLNRLRSDSFRPLHRLQADPTVSYGCVREPERAPSCADFDGRHITRAMLRDGANRYNSYRHGGLPPGPISNPGLASLEAVLDAAQHDYLYFVARGHGRHSFSATLAAHNARVGEYLERQRAAQRDAGD
ncbi:MAG: endolytic transglycosylase MltG [Deltaproteobacteria bacterium]|nr:endolytic transglycosylase MltG [Deltaproteobacteria bacterium]